MRLWVYLLLAAFCWVATGIALAKGFWVNVALSGLGGWCLMLLAMSEAAGKAVRR